MYIASPNSPTIPPSEDIIREAFSMDTLKRFFHLLEHSKTFVQVHGPYTTVPETTVFSRATIPRLAEYPPSVDTLAKSLAAAHDSMHSAQPNGPAKEDLQVFKLLWDATVDLLEKILETGKLDLEAYGWGVYGLASGYIEPQPSPLDCEHDILFANHKDRLYEALQKLPDLNAPHHNPRSAAQRLDALAKVNRQAHVCASLVMQRLRGDRFVRVRWWHGVSVAERWARSLGWVPAKYGKGIEKGSGAIPVESTVDGAVDGAANSAVDGAGKVSRETSGETPDSR